MSISSQDKIDYNIIPKFHVKKQWKYACCAAWIVGIVSHLYQMTNMLANDDTITAYYAPLLHTPREIFSGASSGRWLLMLAEMPISWFKTPVTSGVLVLLIIALVSVCVVGVMRIESPLGAVLVGAIIASFPFWMASFSMQSVALPLSVLLACASVLLIECGKFSWIWCGIMLGLSLAIFPPYISCALLLIVYRLMWILLGEDTFSYEKFWKAVAKYLLLGIVALVVWIGGTAFLMLVFKYESTGYQGASDAMSGTFLQHFPYNLKMTIVKTAELCSVKMTMMPQLLFTVLFCYGAQAVAVIYLTISRQLQKQPLRLLLLLLCIFSLPFSLCTMTVVSAEFAYRGQHRAVWMILLSGGLMFAEMILRRTWAEKKPLAKRVGKAFYALCCGMSLLMCYGFFLFDNIGYYNQQFVMEKDEALMTRVMSALEQTDGFTYDSPVYFLSYGLAANVENGTSPLSMDYGLYRNMILDTDTNLWCYGDSSYKAHIKRLQGIELATPDDASIEIIDSNEKYKVQCYEQKPFEYSIVIDRETGVYVVLIKTLIPPFVLDSQ